MKTTPLRLLAATTGILLVLAAILATPAVLASVAAGAAGLLVVTTAAQLPATARPAPVAIVRVIEVQTTQVFELEDGAGIVVFRRVDGKLTSRLYRNKAAA